MLTMLTPAQADNLSWEEKFDIKLYADISAYKANTQAMQDKLGELKTRFINLMKSHGFKKTSEPTVTVGMNEGKAVMALQCTVQLEQE